MLYNCNSIALCTHRFRADWLTMQDSRSTSVPQQQSGSSGVVRFRNVETCLVA